MLGCTHFIDDLEEVLAHPDFPVAVERLLFDPYTENGGGEWYASVPYLEKNQRPPARRRAERRHQ